MRLAVGTDDEVVDVVAMGHGFVSAVGAVDVAIVMAAAAMRGAGIGVGVGDGDGVLFDGAVFTLMVKVAVVQVVDVAVVLDGGVAAAFAVLVGVVVVLFTHG